MDASAIQCVSLQEDAARAVKEISEQIGDSEPDVLFMFCSSAYDLKVVGESLKAAFNCPIIACSSSGQIGPTGFQRGGMTAMAIRGGYLKVELHLIKPLADYRAQSSRVGSAIRESNPDAGGHGFCFLVVDGLSMMEEQLISALYQELDDVPIVGGSAGDDLAFQQTHIYFDGQFLSDAALIAACRAQGPVVPFVLNHFSPGKVHLVITDSDPDNRIIREFNGEPAALAYAEAIGVPVAQLHSEVFSRYPLLLRIGDDHYVRAIARMNPDLSLALYCAIDTGRVVTIGEEFDPAGALRKGLEKVLATVPDPLAIIACDCILRRIEFEQLGIDPEVGAYLAQHRVFGFSTYGEQINGLHVNQTLTGLVLGPADKQ